MPVESGYGGLTQQQYEADEVSEGVKGRAWGINRANFDRNLAVVIGIDRYENPSIRNLSTAVSDASAIADLLEQEYAYKQSDESQK